jgi:hypothetical protein
MKLGSSFFATYGPHHRSKQPFYSHRHMATSHLHGGLAFFAYCTNYLIDIRPPLRDRKSADWNDRSA